MKYAVDEIIDNIVKLENIENGDIVEIELFELPKNLEEGNILVYEDNKFIKDLNEEELRRKRIEDKFNRLKQLGEIMTKKDN